MEHFSKVDTTVRYKYGGGQFGLAAVGKPLSEQRLNRYRGYLADPVFKSCSGGGGNVYAPGSKLWK